MDGTVNLNHILHEIDIQIINVVKGQICAFFTFWCRYSPEVFNKRSRFYPYLFHQFVSKIIFIPSCITFSLDYKYILLKRSMLFQFPVLFLQTVIWNISLCSMKSLHYRFITSKSMNRTVHRRRKYNNINITCKDVFCFL